MITKKELRRVDELRCRRDELESLLRSFESRHVRTRVGLVEINGASPRKPMKSEHAQFFHCEMKELMKGLTGIVVDKIRHELKAIDLEISQYIGSGDDDN